MTEKYGVFAANLKRYMGTMRIRDLSELTGICDTQIINYRMDRQLPNLYNALRIAKALDIPLEYLTEGMII